jgi:TATA-binding protein-associated factor
VVESRVNVVDVFATAEEWPFTAICEELCVDLFHQQWEIRHGAAVGLRELIKIHGAVCSLFAV